MDRMTIRPRAGLAVPMPEGGTLPAEGLDVDRSLFWQRRLADGDVEMVPSAAAEGASAQTKTPAKVKE